MADRKTRRASEAVVADDVVEEVKGGGMGLDDGIILTTFLLLIGAVILTWVALGRYPG